MGNEKEIDATELSRCNGAEGRPTYIAHGERVVDVSQSPLWAGGTHMGMHTAGRDLTADIEAAPHGTEVLDRYPQVARLIKKKTPEAKDDLPPYVSQFLGKHPFFRRHLHPLTVHFPIVFTLSASFFSMLFLVTGNRSFDQTAFYCLIGALLFTPPAIATGFATWWVNYKALPMRPVTIKISLSLVLLPLLLFLWLWHATSGAAPESFSGSGLVYVVLVIAIAPIVVTIAYFGGTLTFPLPSPDRGP